MKVLANDGISNSGIEKLLNNGIDIKNITVEQGQLIDYINKNEITVLLVRSATKVRKDIIDNCPGLIIIGRGGVGMDNIDVEYAIDKGIKVINTPAASSGSVAELVIAHLYTCARFLHISNRNMPLEGDSNFKKLKKAFAKGVELRGKTLGIIGFGRIGQEVAKIGLGIGMNVIYYDLHNDKVNLKLEFFDRQILNFKLEKSSFIEVLSKSDFITLHVPAQKEYVIGNKEFDLMKDGIGLINAARGGVVDEVALDKNISDGKVSFAALDTFENEPNPEIKLLMNPKISLTPHIGAATNEAQDRIGLELADQIIEILK
ncbi:D-2-hydroxyacid dehydrogenase [Flavobacteriaceae bacterium]|nr:D-2-hydroxyacid dehydrogenase [Flavobacteriales bacterium]MBL6877548.1 D-2-hydroxyacid dehydrogenase [Flavobacteriaceae bacterium]MDA9551208.1 D-2-hydroxyacid dehydrogenase [Flavobacteriaceae bacterium]MDA9849374.1 D-2-hydroxyacid dehydrogenase [Flavobacteriaceae bacterium]